MRRWFWGGFAIIAICASAIVFLNRFDPCDTVVERVLPSPKKNMSLVVFRRDCGATVDFNTQVSLLPAGKSFDVDAYPPFFGVSGRSNVSVDWLSENRVRIVAPKSENVFHRAGSVGAVVVTYE